MSDGLARAAGGGVPIFFDGQTILLQPLTLKDFAAVEQYLLSKRQNPLDMVKSKLAGLDIETQKYLLELAYEDAKRQTTISASEAGEFIDSVDGLAFTLWLVLERSHQGRWTLERVNEIVKSMTPTEIQEMLRLRDQASGLDDLGNSTGQTSEAEMLAKRKKTATAEVQVNGVGLSANSAKRTTTRRRK